MGIHKHGHHNNSSQLGIKSLGTRIPRIVGHGLDHYMGCIICVTACVAVPDPT